jgi:two-component system cell cycle response regulator DivK
MQANLFKKSAVLIEKNLLHCRLYEDVLAAHGFEVYVAKSPMDGLMKVKETEQDLVVINTEIAEETFLEKFISKMKSEKASNFMPIVGLSTYNLEYKKNFLKMLDIFLTKPFSIDRFIESISACIESKANGRQSSNN